MTKTYTTKDAIFKQAQIILRKSLRDVISESEIKKVEAEIAQYNNQKKGLLGELVERLVFGLETNNRAEADFHIAGVELKTNPLKKHPKKKYVSKERLVFSMIDYGEVVNETWRKSSFLKKNKVLLLMFYLWLKEQSIIDYEFKFVYLLNLLEDISDEDILQIQKDWEFIVEKIKRGEAHLLSEGDTYYLGACTKAANSRVVRDQPQSRTLAKPRAFSFKQQYLNYLIQKKLLGKEVNTESIFKKVRRITTVEDLVKSKFSRFINKTDKEILVTLDEKAERKSKQYKRILANRILGVRGSKVEELEKANVTLKVITLEPSGTLKESLSFPAFDYKDLVTQVWYDEDEEKMSDLHYQLETKKFLFVVFQKIKESDDIVLKKTMFWNFPMEDVDKAKEVWEKTISLINEGRIVKEIKIEKNGKERRFTYFPGLSFNGVAHVRPHGADKEDENELPTHDELTGKSSYTKQCFWLNATYIQRIVTEELTET